MSLINKKEVIKIFGEEYSYHEKNLNIYNKQLEKIKINREELKNNLINLKNSKEYQKKIKKIEKKLFKNELRQLKQKIYNFESERNKIIDILNGLDKDIWVKKEFSKFTIDYIKSDTFIISKLLVKPMATKIKIELKDYRYESYNNKRVGLSIGMKGNPRIYVSGSPKPKIKKILSEYEVFNISKKDIWDERILEIAEYLGIYMGDNFNFYIEKEILKISGSQYLSEFKK